MRDEERITVLTIQNIQHLQDAENKCKDMIRERILRFKSKKHSKTENKRKARREEENFGEIPVKEVNVAALISVKEPKVYWLKQMMESDQACILIEEYLPSVSESEGSDTE